MKTTSTVLTILLLIPIMACAFFAFQSYERISIGFSGATIAKTVAIQQLLPIITYLVCAVISVVLIVKQKYLESSIMCGTVIAFFMLSYLISSIGVFVIQLWSK
jgi:hypothetical protein